MIGRAIVAAVATVALLWSAVMLHDARRLEAANASVQRPDDPAALAAARGDLEAARMLNPDSAPDVSLSAVLRAQGDGEGAIRLLRGVVRAEPANLTAWRLLALYARDVDPALEREALANQRRLDPLGTR